MKTTTRLLLAALFATGIAALAGCANHPELRPYTAAETQELQLEVLARQGLSFEEFSRQKAAILRAHTDEGVAAVTTANPPLKG